MARHLIADSHHGHNNQVLEAVNNLGPRQRKAFDQHFPDFETWAEDPYTDKLDPEYSSWVADWIEGKTQMYWEDGDLWSRR